MVLWLVRSTLDTGEQNFGGPYLPGLLYGLVLKIRCEHCENQNVTGRRHWLPFVSTPVGKCEEYAALFSILVHMPCGWRRHFGNS